MGYLKFLFVGIFFGIVLTKSQVISWYRIFEMFHFHSFHMYGVIGSAVITGIIGTALIKKYKLNTSKGLPISFTPKAVGVFKYFIGGIIFGLGWAMSGACPGPMYVLIGNGFGVFTIVLLSAVIGTFTYGIIRNKLPH